MVNLKSLIYVGAAFALGAISPFLPLIAGQPVIALAAAAVLSLVLPTKSKGQIILFLIVWVLSFALFASIFGGAP